MVPWSHLRQPFSGWLMTVLTSELTHFNLVIRLSKAKRLALPFSSLLGLSRWSVGPRVPRRNACLSEWSRSEQSEISFFRCSFSEWSDMCMCITTRHEIRQVHGLRCGPFLLFVVVWWGQTCCAPNSLEFEQLFMPLRLTWLPSRQGNNARPLGI